MKSKKQFLAVVIIVMATGMFLWLSVKPDMVKKAVAADNAETMKMLSHAGISIAAYQRG